MAYNEKDNINNISIPGLIDIYQDQLHNC